MSVLFAEAAGELVAVHGPDVEAFPFSMVVSRSDAADLPDEGDVTVEAGAVLLADGRRIVARAVAGAAPSAPGAAPAALLAHLAALPGYPERAAELASLADPLRRALAEGADPLPAAATMLGRGAGLTPSGDDVLLGAIAMAAHGHREWGVLDPAPLAGALAALAPSRTTAVSIAFLRAAARGRFAPVVGAVCRATPETLPAALRRLAAVGASSGLDTAVGIGLVCAVAAPTWSAPRPRRRSPARS